MRKIFFISLAALLLTSCNLFIEDVDDEAGFKDVPVHTGEGYDAPVTVNDDHCEVTYQYNSCVRKLSEQEQTQWIVSAESDAVGGFMEIHYSKTTPEELLPVPGEILVSGVTDKFPWGCNHRVQYRVDEDGVYKYIVAFATLEDTFKELDINGSLRSEHYEEYYTTAIEEDEQTEEQTRAVNFEADGVHVEFDEGSTLSVNVPISGNVTMELPNGLTGSIIIDPKKNYTKKTINFDFSDFSISKGVFKAKITTVIDEKVDIEVKGGYQKNWRIHRWRPIRGKAFTVGPVVLVLFLNIDLSANVNFQISSHVTRHKVTQTVYDVDFRKLTMDKTTSILKDEEWNIGQAAVTASFALSVQFQLGLGIYGKILSVRFIPEITAGVEATVPLTKDDGEGGSSFDLSSGVGLEFKVQLKLYLGVFIDFSLQNILGTNSFNSEAQKQLLKDLEAKAKKSSSYYQDLVDKENAEYDPNKKYYKNDKAQKEGDEELGVKKEFGPWTIYGPKKVTWFPQIDDNSFRIDPLWNEQTKKMSFRGQFAIKETGFFVGLGIKYVPALRIMKGSQYVTTLFPDEGGMAADVRKGKTYHFSIPNTNNDVHYTAIPCYFKKPVTRSAPDAFDLALTFCSTSPSISITDVSLDRVDYYGPENGHSYNLNNKGQAFKYRYLFYVDTRTSLKGADNMDSWGVNEAVRFVDKKSNKGDFEKAKDGTYTMHWEFSVFSNEKGVKNVFLMFCPYFYAQGNYVIGEYYKCTVYNDGFVGWIEEENSSSPLIDEGRTYRFHQSNNSDVTECRLVSMVLH